MLDGELFESLQFLAYQPTFKDRSFTVTYRTSLPLIVRRTHIE